MIVQQLRSNRFSLALLDSGVKDIWINRPKMKRYLSACLPVFEEFIFSKSGLNLSKFRVQEIDLTMTLCGIQRIRTLNRDYRKKDKKTDVLSFPIHEELRFEKDSPVFSMLNLGDVIICKEVARAQSAEFNISVEEETVHLLVHGFLHVLGYDHEISEKEEEIMQNLEKRILNKISKKLKR